MRASTTLTALAVILGLVSPASGSAQYAAAQDSTLAGLQKVFVNFTDLGQGLGSGVSEALRGSAILELRKAGIRVARDAGELDANDAVLNISFITTQRTLVTDLCLRIDLEQMAQLQRTKQSSRMVTWYYEKSALNAIVKDAAPLMLAKGIDEFMSKWLDMNGR